jgi:hypothetical protein
VAELLQATLDEEKAADKKLSELADGGINEAATLGAMPGTYEGSVKDRSSAPGGKRPAKMSAAGNGRGRHVTKARASAGR